MLEQSVIIALIVLSIWYTMQEGEIFAGLGRWFEKNLPAKVHPAVFECNVCMSFWYGSALYWILYGHSMVNWLVVVVVAMGINIVINKLSPEKNAVNE
jgi:hypothetical protein